MKWRKYTINTTTEALDLVSNMLDEFGIEGIEIEDHVPLTAEDKKQMFVDILPDPIHDDGKAIIRFYQDIEEDNKILEEQIKKGLQELSLFVNLGDGTVTQSETEDIDWMNNWKEFFKPFRLSKQIVINPTWEDVTKISDLRDSDIVIEIDPGIAFGTGSHETTKLCIFALERYLKPGMRLLDVGCGSGILSIAGVKLGAEFALGIDIDPNALHSTYENVEINGITKKFEAMSGNIIEDTALQQEVGYECYDIVVANILADVIIPLSGKVAQHMKPGGLFISSGIIGEKQKEVQEILIKNRFHILEIQKMGDWISFVVEK